MYSLSRQRVHAFGHADIIFESFPKTKFTMLVPEVATQLKDMRKRGADTVVLCGIETHVCILATCQDLRAQGFNVSDNLSLIKRKRCHEYASYDASVLVQ